MHLKILAVDFGDARTGLACCDRTEFLASPVGVIHDYHLESTAQKVAHAVEEFEAKMVVVGHPINLDGSHGTRAQRCEEFAACLGTLTDVPVCLWDERGTTVSAHGYLNEMDTRGKKRKEVVDELAAAIILQNYLDYRHNNPQAEEKT